MKGLNRNSSSLAFLTNRAASEEVLAQFSTGQLIVSPGAQQDFYGTALFLGHSRYFCCGFFFDVTQIFLLRNKKNFFCSSLITTEGTNADEVKHFDPVTTTREMITAGLKRTGKSE